VAREGLNVQRRHADLLKVRLPGTHDRHTVRTSWGDDRFSVKWMPAFGASVIV